MAISNLKTGLTGPTLAAHTASTDDVRPATTAVIDALMARAGVPQARTAAPAKAAPAAPPTANAQLRRRPRYGASGHALEILFDKTVADGAAGLGNDRQRCLQMAETLCSPEMSSVERGDVVGALATVDPAHWSQVVSCVAQLKMPSMGGLELTSLVQSVQRIAPSERADFVALCAPWCTSKLNSREVTDCVAMLSLAQPAAGRVLMRDTLDLMSGQDISKKAQ